MTGHRGTRAVQRMVEFAPATGSLALWAAHQDIADRSDERVIFTDGRTLFYGPRSRCCRWRNRLVSSRTRFYISPFAMRSGISSCARCGAMWILRCSRCAPTPSSTARLRTSMAQAAGIRGVPGQADRCLARARSERRTGAQRMGRRAALPGHRRSQEDRRRCRSGASDRASDAAEPTARATANAAGRRMARAPPASGNSSPHSARPAPHPSAKGPPEAEADEVLKWSERIVRGHASDGAFSMLGAWSPTSRKAARRGNFFAPAARPGAVAQASAVLVAALAFLHRQPRTRRPQPALALGTGHEHHADRATAGGRHRCFGIHR